MFFDFAFECLLVFRLGVENDVAAGDKGLDIGKAQRLKQPTEVIHFDGVAANVDSAQKSDVFWHRCSLSRYGLWTLDFGLWTLDFGLWTLVFGLWSLVFVRQK